jgi:hypothetical protein
VVYWLTGWEFLRRCLTWHSRRKLYPRPSSAVAQQLDSPGYITTTWGPRLNANRYIYGIAAYLGECGREFNFEPGGYPGRTITYGTELPWIIDALEARAYNTADTRDGFVGQSYTATEGGGAAGSRPWTMAESTGGITNFQGAIPVEWLAIYYRYVYPDSRIPGMIKANADHIVAQTRLKTSADTLIAGPNRYVYGYEATPRPDATALYTTVATTTTGGTSLPVASTTGFLVGSHVSVYNPVSEVTHWWGLVTAIPSGTTLTVESPIGLALNAPIGVRVAQQGPSGSWTLGMWGGALGFTYAHTGTVGYATWAERTQDVNNVSGLGFSNGKEWVEPYAWAASAAAYRLGAAARPLWAPTAFTQPAAE